MTVVDTTTPDDALRHLTLVVEPELIPASLLKFSVVRSVLEITHEGRPILMRLDYGHLMLGGPEQCNAFLFWGTLAERLGDHKVGTKATLKWNRGWNDHPASWQLTIGEHTNRP